MIESKEAGVEPARHTCVRLTGFEVRPYKWNQRLKADLVAFSGLFHKVSSPKRVPARTRLCSSLHTASDFNFITHFQNPKTGEICRVFGALKHWIFPRFGGAA